MWLSKGRFEQVAEADRAACKLIGEEKLRRLARYEKALHQICGLTFIGRSVKARKIAQKALWSGD